MRRPVCIDSSNKLARWPWRLASLGMFLALAGCDSTSGPDSTGANSRSAEAGGGLSGRTSSTGRSASNQASSTGKSQAKVVSQIEGDRLTVVAPVVLSKQTESSPFRFAEVAQESGIDFVHFSGMTEEKHFPTANGSGVAIFDFDNDGLMDIYFASATVLPLGTAEKGPNRLFKNLGKGKFKDVTEASGLGYRGFCHGIIVADLDNDGDQDVQIQIGAMYSADWFTDAIYLNPGHGNHYITIRPIGVQTNKLGSGARITTVVETPTYPGGKRTIYNRVTSGGTYGSGSYQAEIGLGDATRIVSITVYWPVSGITTVYTDVPLDSIISITEGKLIFEVVLVNKIDLKLVGIKMVDDWTRGIVKPHCAAH